MGLLDRLTSGLPSRADQVHDWRPACTCTPCPSPGVAEIGNAAVCFAHLRELTAQGYRIDRWLTTRIRLREPRALLARVERHDVIAIVGAGHVLTPEQARACRDLGAHVAAEVQRHIDGAALSVLARPAWTADMLRALMVKPTGPVDKHNGPR